MLRACIFILLGLVVALAFGSDARAERRVALVVGNATYVHAPTLRNPRNDASDMAAALRKEGFQVILGLDLDQEHFADTIQRFARLLDDADVALFYYAGHGLQIDGKNYLVSVNARLNNEFLISSETIGLNAIVRLMESKVPMDLIFLDACRDDPLADNLRKNLIAMQRGGELGRGLARIEPTGRDTLIAFAAAPGQEAADGKGRNSPFTAALLKYISRPNLEVSVMLKLVAADVREKTGNSQRPQQLSDMSRTFYFAKPEMEMASTTPSAPHKAPAPPSMPRTAAPSSNTDAMVEVAFWNSVQNAHSCDAVRAYMQRFPDGIFIALAKQAEQRLCFSAQDRHVTIVQSAPNANNNPQPAAPPSQTEPSSPQSPPQIQQDLKSAPSSNQVATAKADLTPPPAAPTLTPPTAPKSAQSPPPPANAFTNLPPSASSSATEHQVATAQGLTHSPPVPTLTPPAAAPKPAQSPQPTANAPTNSPPPVAALTPPAAEPEPVQSSQPALGASTSPPASPPAASTAPAPATTLPEETTKIAALPKPQAPGGQPAKEIDRVARDLQRELVRVGCSVGRIDGKWGPRSRDALRKFEHYAGLDLDAEIPSQSAIDAVRKRNGHICPEPLERPARAERAHRREHTTRTSEEFSRLSAEPQTRRKDWRSINPLCQSAYYQGSRLCCTYDAPNQPPVIICP
jgi:hypothetical protein